MTELRYLLYFALRVMILVTGDGDGSGGDCKSVSESIVLAFLGVCVDRSASGGLSL